MPNFCKHGQITLVILILSGKIIPSAVYSGDNPRYGRSEWITLLTTCLFVHRIMDGSVCETLIECVPVIRRRVESRETRVDPVLDRWWGRFSGFFFWVVRGLGQDRYGAELLKQHGIREGDVWPVFLRRLLRAKIRNEHRISINAIGSQSGQFLILGILAILCSC